MEKIIGKVTCPHCGAVQEMEIPQSACVPFYDCAKCGKRVAAKNECCVFCEYGDRACPVGHPQRK